MYYSLNQPLYGTRTTQVPFGMAQSKKVAGVRFVQLKDADAVGKKAASLVADQLAAKPEATLVFPTGSTPKPMYAALRGMKSVDWSKSRLFQLDEYVNPQPQAVPPYETFAEFMDRELWSHVGGQKVYMRDFTDRPQAYEQLLMQQGGPDLVILGIGLNGHIAFNEPGPESTPDSPTRLETLKPQTLASNFKENAGRPGYPVEAATLGLKAILSAKHILLLATGSDKQAIVRRAFTPQRSPSADCPASWLKQHPNVTVITDFEV